VISDPNPQGRFLVVNITTAYSIPPGGDGWCILQKDAHECVDHQSVVFYSKAIIMTIDQFDKGIALKSIELYSRQINPSLLKKIQDKAKNNPALPFECEEYFPFF
jgi:hypothetical protein